MEARGPEVFVAGYRWVANIFPVRKQDGAGGSAPEVVEVHGCGVPEIASTCFSVRHGVCLGWQDGNPEALGGRMARWTRLFPALAVALVLGACGQGTTDTPFSP